MKINKYYVLFSCLLLVTLVSYGQSDSTTQEIVIVDSQEEALRARKVKVPFGELANERVVGSISTITQSEITTADLDVNSALIGRTPSLNVRKFSSQPGNDNTGLLVRGFHTIVLNKNSNNEINASQNPMIVIDGIANRTLESLNFYEIESITVLKDVTAKALYGAQAANGVILVTTKRGQEGVKAATFSAEAGFRRPTHIPDFVDGFEYATLYNEALANDGAERLFTRRDRIGLLSAGINDTLPSVDFYDRYLKNFTSFQRLYGTYTNSDNNFTYFLSAGVVAENGLEAIGQQTEYRRFNIRGNLDFKASEVFSFRLDIASRLDFTNSNRLTYSNWAGNSSFFTTMSTQRPTDYPIFIAPGRLGGSEDVSTNIEGELTQAGFVKDELRTSQLRTSAIIDFAPLGVEGLKLDNSVAVDAISSLRFGKEEEYARFDSDGNQLGLDNPTSDQTVNSSDLSRIYAFTSTLTYDKVIGRSDFSVLSNFMYQERERGGLVQPTKNMNWGTRINYMLDSKYVIEANVSYMGTNILEKGNRFRAFPSAGIAWIASNEKFLENVSAVSFLKLRASYGQIGFDANLPFFAFRSGFGQIGSTQFGLDQSPQNEPAHHISTNGNPAIDYEVSTELNIGISARLFKNLSLEIDLFNEDRTDIPMFVNTVIPSYVGELTIPLQNFGEVNNQGFEVELGYLGEFGQVAYRVGGFLAYTKATFERTGDLEPEDYLNRDGQPLDRILGYQANGFFTDDSQVNGSNRLDQNVTAGDLRYTDVNGDGFLNANDRYVIGNSLPRTTFGFNFNVSYQDFSLFVLTQGSAGFNRVRGGWTSYTGRGNQKFAANARNSWTPDNQNASHPRLTSLNTNHSYVNSTFWLTDDYFFTFRNVELRYSLPLAVRDRLGSPADFSVFLRGTDLLSISNDMDFNSDNPTAGLTNGFLMKTASIGITVTY